jgi:hypothetical protein
VTRADLLALLLLRIAAEKWHMHRNGMCLWSSHIAIESPDVMLLASYGRFAALAI